MLRRNVEHNNITVNSELSYFFVTAVYNTNVIKFVKIVEVRLTLDGFSERNVTIAKTINEETKKCLHGSTFFMSQLRRSLRPKSNTWRGATDTVTCGKIYKMLQLINVLLTDIR